MLIMKDGEPISSKLRSSIRRVPAFQPPNIPNNLGLLDLLTLDDQNVNAKKKMY
jgi:hypothetical protein